MGLFSSKSSSTTANTSQTGDGGADVGIGASGVDLLNLSNVGRDVDLTVNEAAVEASDIERIIGAISTSNRGIASSIIAANAPIADVARSATGAESEAGRLANKFGVPVLLLIGLFLLIRSRA